MNLDVISETTIDDLVANLPPVHPAARVFPLLEPDRLRDLAADIASHGQRFPIVCQDGVILDGRNRWIACRLVNVEPVFTECATGGSPTAYIISANLHRRHLTPEQRAAIAAELATLKPGDNQHTREAPPIGRTSISQDEAAAAMQVSTRQVQRAAVVKKQAPDLHEQVKAGTVKLREATKKIATRRSKRGGKQKATKTPHPSLAVILAALPGLDLGALRRVQAAVEKMIAQRAGGDVQK